MKLNANNLIFRASPAKLALNSKYFEYIISGLYGNEADYIDIPT